MTNQDNKNQPKVAEQPKQQAIKSEASAAAPAAATTAKVAEPKKKADNVVSIANASSRDKTVQEHFSNTSEKLAQTIDMASRLMNETFSISREQMEACIEASNITAECAQKIGESLYQATNEAISENVEHCKHFFSCRTASDVIELQTRLAQANIERFFGNNSRISTMLFNFGSKASEPFADKLSDASDRIQRIFK